MRPTHRGPCVCGCGGPICPVTGRAPHCLSDLHDGLTSSGGRGHREGYPETPAEHQPPRSPQDSRTQTLKLGTHFGATVAVADLGRGRDRPVTRVTLRGDRPQAPTCPSVSPRDEASFVCSPNQSRKSLGVTGGPWGVRTRGETRGPIAQGDPRPGAPGVAICHQHASEWGGWGRGAPGRDEWGQCRHKTAQLKPQGRR